MQYGYGYPPPPFYGYPPPVYPPQGITPDIEARAIKIAAKLVNKEQKKKDKEKDIEAKKKADEKKKIEDGKRRTLFGLEWYILGILSYPFVGPLYYYITHIGSH